MFDNSTWNVRLHYTLPSVQHWVRLNSFLPSRVSNVARFVLVRRDFPFAAKFASDDKYCTKSHLACTDGVRHHFGRSWPCRSMRSAANDTYAADSITHARTRCRRPRTQVMINWPRLFRRWRSTRRTWARWRWRRWWWPGASTWAACAGWPQRHSWLVCSPGGCAQRRIWETEKGAFFSITREQSFQTLYSRCYDKEARISEDVTFFRKGNVDGGAEAPYLLFFCAGKWEGVIQGQSASSRTSRSEIFSWMRGFI